MNANTSRRLYGIVGVLLVVPATTGCSFLFVQAPPSDATDEEIARAPVECTSSHVLPTLDVTGVAASGLNVALVASSPTFTDDQKKVLVPLHAVYGVLYAVSAVYGYRQVTKCRALKEKFEHGGANWKPALKQ